MMYVLLYKIYSQSFWYYLISFNAVIIQNKQQKWFRPFIYIFDLQFSDSFFFSLLLCSTW